MINDAVAKFAAPIRWSIMPGFLSPKLFNEYTEVDFANTVGECRRILPCGRSGPFAKCRLWRHIVIPTTSLSAPADEGRAVGAGIAHQGRGQMLPSPGLGNRVRGQGHSRECAASASSERRDASARDAFLAGLHPAGRMAGSEIVEVVLYLSRPDSRIGDAAYRLRASRPLVTPNDLEGRRSRPMRDDPNHFRKQTARWRKAALFERPSIFHRTRVVDNLYEFAPLW